jgi:hypothetical protein
MRMPEEHWVEWLVNQVRSMANLPETWYELEHPDCSTGNTDGEYGGVPDEHARSSMEAIIRALEKPNLKPDYIDPQFEGGIILWFEDGAKNAAIVAANGEGEPTVQIQNLKDGFNDCWLIDMQENGEEDRVEELYLTLEETMKKIKTFFHD